MCWEECLLYFEPKCNGDRDGDDHGNGMPMRMSTPKSTRRSQVGPLVALLVILQSEGTNASMRHRRGEPQSARIALTLTYETVQATLPTMQLAQADAAEVGKVFGISPWAWPDRRRAARSDAEANSEVIVKRGRGRPRQDNTPKENNNEGDLGRRSRQS